MLNQRLRNRQLELQVVTRTVNICTLSTRTAYAHRESTMVRREPVQLYRLRRKRSVLSPVYLLQR